MNNIEWKPFTMGELFDIKRGESLYLQDTNDGNIPYISATSKNNGISGYIDTYNRDGNMISVAYDGTVGCSFYQPSKWFASEKVVSLSTKDYMLNKYLAEFLCNAIYHQREKYSYGYKFSVDKRMKKQCLLLPAKNNHPDYVYMEEYIKNNHFKKLNNYVSYCKQNLLTLGSIKKIHALSDVDWSDFYINKLFEVPKRGKRIVEKNHLAGDTPLVSSYGQENGVTNFIGNEDNVRSFTDCLSIANGGSSAGKTFYHPYTFIAADHVTQCWNKDLNQYQYLFLATVMTKALTGKYSFSHEISDPRLAKERIMLPTTHSGEPDYEYMEQYIKNMMIAKYNSYINFINK